MAQIFQGLVRGDVHDKPPFAVVDHFLQFANRFYDLFLGNAAIFEIGVELGHVLVHRAFPLFVGGIDQAGYFPFDLFHELVEFCLGGKLVDR
jgi:hypothetical protein